MSAETPYWFEKEWTNTSAKALGVYVVLLYLRFKHPTLDTAKRDVKPEISRHLLGSKAHEAWSSAKAFMEALYRNEETDKYGRITGETDELLETIERSCYETLRRACYEHYVAEEVEELGGDKEYLRRLLRNLRFHAEVTVAGSSYTGFYSSFVYKLVTGENYYELGDEEQRRWGKRADRIVCAMRRAGILWFSCIVPAPFLEEEFVGKLAHEEAVSKPITILPATTTPSVESVKKYVGREPSREVLESIVGDVLGSLGFRVELDKQLPARGGGSVEVDVWGWKSIGDMRFYAYASCKNWGRSVDRAEIDREFGRVLQLNQIPHVKIFVAKELTDPARKAALADGFIVVELREEALEGSAERIYDIVYNHLRELFTGIAPPELQVIAAETKEIAERSSRTY